MATAIRLELVLDSSGAVTGVKQFGNEVENMGNKLPAAGKKAEEAFGGIESSTRRAHAATQLWVRLTGTEMPKALENVIAHSKSVGPLLAGAFNAGIIATAGVAIVGVIGNIVTWAKELGGATEELTRMKEAAISANLAAIANPQTLATAREHIVLQNQVVARMQQEADQWRESNQLAKAYTHTLAFLGDEESQQQVDSEKRFNQNNDALLLLMKNTQDLTRSVRASRLESQKEIDEAGLKGFALIRQQHIDEDKMARNSFDLQSGLSDALSIKIRANAARAKAANMELFKSISDSLIQLAQSTQESILKGDDLINEHLRNSIENFENGLMEKSGFTYAQLKKDQASLAAIGRATDLFNQKADHDRVELHRQALDKVMDLESEAAIAIVPEWRRAEAQIRAEHEKTFRDLVEHQKEFGLSDEQLNQMRIANDALANAKIRDEHKRLVEELGSDLQSVFDDIGSGNIGKRILANIEKLFFQIVAQWLLSLNIMKSAAGSILGSIVFGPGSTGSNVFGGGSLLSGLLGGGGGGSGGGLFGGAGSQGTQIGTSGLSGLSAAAAGTAGASSASLFSASGALTSPSISSLASPSGTVSLSGTVSGGTTGLLGAGGLFSGKGLSALAPLGIMSLGSMGGKLGMIGSMLSTGAITLGPQLLSALGVSSKFAPLILGTLAFAGAGLSGFGLGQQLGKGLGALAGAGQGALTGFMVGGPIGALVGGIIGLLGGIFGGIFGGGKRKKQANAFFDNSVSPAIAEIIQGFDTFQLDNSAALQQLEQLRTDAQKQLSALKSQGKDVFNQRVGPAIDSAETHIRDIQAERDRRSALVFGPPQFADGGMFRLMGSGAGLAVLHDGEYVVNPEATRKHRSTLDRINAGGSAGFSIGGNLVVNINAPRVDRQYMLSSEFRKNLLDALDRARKEGEI